MKKARRQVTSRRRRLPREYSLVRHVPTYGAKSGINPFSRRQVLIFFGEIPNMPGHCIVADHKTGRLYSGYHTERFVEIPADED